MGGLLMASSLVALLSPPVAPAEGSATTVGAFGGEELWTYRGRKLTLIAPPSSGLHGAWKAFYVLGAGRRGTWSIVGRTAATALTCGSKRSSCRPMDQAGLALSWTSKRFPVSFFAGVQFTTPAFGTTAGASRTQKASPVATVGMIVTLPDMLDAVKLVRGLPTSWLSRPRPSPTPGRPTR